MLNYAQLLFLFALRIKCFSSLQISGSGFCQEIGMGDVLTEDALFCHTKLRDVKFCQLREHGIYMFIHYSQ